jgi:hypothetical protein
MDECWSIDVADIRALAMNPLFHQISRQLHALDTRAALLETLADIEDNYDAFDGVDQEIADRLIADLNRRLAALDAAPG